MVRIPAALKAPRILPITVRPPNVKPNNPAPITNAVPKMITYSRIPSSTNAFYIASIYYHMVSKKSINCSLPSLNIQLKIQIVTKIGKIKNYRGHQKASSARTFDYVSK